MSWLDTADGASDWSRAHVVVAGMGRSGFAAADGLLERGATVHVVDDNDGDANAEKATILEVLGATVTLGPGSTAHLPGGCDLVITSPGWRPTQPLLAQAGAQSVPVWGETELAWRLQHPDHVVPWLAVTGTNGKTTTTQMLESILLAAGLKAAAVGNIGRPVMEALADDVTHDVLAVELSSFQLHWTRTLSVHSGAVLNVQPDHLEWYDQPDGYQRDKARIYHQAQHACVYNVTDPATERMVEDADVVEGARAIGFTPGIPGMSMLGVVDDMLVDRAFVEQRRTSALELCSVNDVVPSAPHNIENALAAAALARSFGVPAQAVRDGLRHLTLGPHRIQTVATVGGVTWVNDSKATNPHAAHSSLRAYDSVVWIAGGQAKGTTFDDLVADHASRLRAAVLMGVDAEIVAAALTQHAPHVPVIRVEGRDTGVMDKAVADAARVAQPGDTVLLAPGCASLDMFSGYDQRGDLFAEAVRRLNTH